MTQYMRKSKTVEAVLFDSKNLGELMGMLGTSKSAFTFTTAEEGDPKLKVTTIDGNKVSVPYGAYVVVDGAGYAYPCDKKLFEADHEIAPQGAERG